MCDCQDSQGISVRGMSVILLDSSRLWGQVQNLIGPCISSLNIVLCVRLEYNK